MRKISSDHLANNQNSVILSKEPFMSSGLVYHWKRDESIAIQGVSGLFNVYYFQIVEKLLYLKQTVSTFTGCRVLHIYLDPDSYRMPSSPCLPRS